MTPTDDLSSNPASKSAPTDSSSIPNHGRRTFLLGTSAAAAAITALSNAKAAEVGPLTGTQRSQKAYQIRVNAAQAERQIPTPLHPVNGDESRYATRIGSFTKGLPHNSNGEVDAAAFDKLVNALSTGNPADFEAIPLGGTRLLVNPQSALGFDLEGSDSHKLAILPAPALSGSEEAGEMVELYWHALLRDVPFSEFNNATTNPLVLAAVEDLNQLSNFKGPRENSQVTPQTLFRGNVAYTDPNDKSGRTGVYYTPPGVTEGPYLSQFLWMYTPFGTEYVNRQIRTTVAGVDYMTSFDEFLSVQNGVQPTQSQVYDPVRRYIINGRDLGQWVHIDVLFQAYFDACLILLGGIDPNDLFSSGIAAPVNPGNPYLGSKTQQGFGTFGGPYFINLVSEVATRALKTVWYQKWSVHRRLRPEAFGGLIHSNLYRGASYPINLEVFSSSALAAIQAQYGAGLLPMAFPEGSPIHPAYGAGHATVAGACVTILKAVFDEHYTIPNPLIPDPNDPTQVVPYTGGPLKVGNELNKLATNIAVGRNIAGVHWRSDAAVSLALGEQLAISILRDQRGTYNEVFNGFTFTKFDGTKITV